MMYGAWCNAPRPPHAALVLRTFTNERALMPASQHTAVSAVAPASEAAVYVQQFNMQHAADAAVE